jgi:uridine kinase
MPDSLSQTRIISALFLSDAARSWLAVATLDLSTLRPILDSYGDEHNYPGKRIANADPSVKRYASDAMLQDVLATIKGARGRTTFQRPVLVGIDGPSGAGKSTWASRIEEGLTDVACVHKDDFYSTASEEVLSRLSPEEGYSSYFDWQRLKDQVLQPLSSGGAARYQRYDWIEKNLGEWVSVPQSATVILVEGVYALRTELRDLYDVKILVRTSDELRASRLIRRAENSLEWLSRWTAAERYYFENRFSYEKVIFVNGDA